MPHHKLFWNSDFWDKELRYAAFCFMFTCTLNNYIILSNIKKVFYIDLHVRK